MRLYKRGAVWWVHYYEGGVRRAASTKCTDRRAAELVAREFERGAASPTHNAATKTTLRSVLDRLLSDRRSRGKASGTVKMYATKAGHWLRILGDIPIARLSAAGVDDYIEQRLKEDTSRNTIGKELTTLRAALKLAKRRGELAVDIDSLMPIGWSNDYKPRDTYVRSPEDLQKLVAELLPDRGAHVCFIVATGARLGESLRARKSDVDLVGGFVRIRGTKTKGADTRIPILPFMLPLLQHALSIGGSTGPLFRPWGNVGHDLASACARAGLERLTPNDLRRTSATWLRQGGVSPHLIASVLRHADSRMVERVYGRMPAESLGSAIDLELKSAPVVRVIPTARAYDGRTVH